MCCSGSHASSEMKIALSAQAVIWRLFGGETTKHTITLRTSGSFDEFETRSCGDYAVCVGALPFN